MLAKVTNPGKAQVSVKVGGHQHTIAPGATVDVIGSGDSLAHLEDLGLVVQSAERDAPPPEGSKKARGLAAAAEAAKAPPGPPAKSKKELKDEAARAAAEPSPAVPPEPGPAPAASTAPAAAPAKKPAKPTP